MASSVSASRSIRRPPTPTATWLRRFLTVLTVLGVCALSGLLLWVLGLIAGPLSLLLLAALLAYIMYPAVVRLQRHMPRFLAILLVFVGALAGLALIAYGMVTTLVDQLALLIDAVKRLAQSSGPGWLKNISITPSRLQGSERDVATLLQAFAGTVLPLVGNVFVLALKSIVVAALLVYFLIYGPRTIAWVRRETPLHSRQSVNFFLDTADQVLGGFLRGALFLACLMGALTGIGAFLLGIPYWLLIAIVVFACEFIPVIGAYISGFVGTLLALTQGWHTALIYLVFVTILQGFLDAQVLIPRIIGKHTGVNPIVATFALLVGASLFGVAGAVLAIPIVAVAQILLDAAWKTYRHDHLEEFPEQPGPEVEPHADTSQTNAGPDGHPPGVVGVTGLQDGHEG